MTESSVTRRQFWLPRPLFSLFLTLLWLLMVNSFSAAHVVLGLLLGVTIPFITRAFWPEQARINHLLPLLRYFSVLLIDIIQSNVVVARRILWRPGDLQPAFFVYPLALEDEFAITILANTISLTPGTVTTHYDRLAHNLLIHGLHVPDEQAVIAQIQAQYEKPLQEIFQ